MIKGGFKWFIPFIALVVPDEDYENYLLDTGHLPTQIFGRQEISDDIVFRYSYVTSDLADPHQQTLPYIDVFLEIIWNPSKKYLTYKAKLSRYDEETYQDTSEFYDNLNYYRSRDNYVQVDSWVPDVAEGLKDVLKTGSLYQYEIRKEFEALYEEKRGQFTHGHGVV